MERNSILCTVFTRHEAVFLRAAHWSGDRAHRVVVAGAFHGTGRGATGGAAGCEQR